MFYFLFKGSNLKNNQEEKITRSNEILKRFSTYFLG